MQGPARAYPLWTCFLQCFKRILIKKTIFLNKVIFLIWFEQSPKVRKVDSQGHPWGWGWARLPPRSSLGNLPSCRLGIAMSFCVLKRVTRNVRCGLFLPNSGRSVFLWGCVGPSPTSSKWVVFWGLFGAYPAVAGWSLVFLCIVSSPRLWMVVSGGPAGFTWG